MRNETQKEEFIKLRSQGVSLEKISSLIHISKTTLVKWSRDYSVEIQNERAMIVDSYREEFEKTKAQKLTDLRKLIGNIESELLSRDFKDTSSEKLIQIHEALAKRMSDELKVTVQERSSNPIYDAAMGEQTISYTLD